MKISFPISGSIGLQLLGKRESLPGGAKKNFLVAGAAAACAIVFTYLLLPLTSHLQYIYCYRSFNRKSLLVGLAAHSAARLYTS